LQPYPAAGCQLRESEPVKVRRNSKQQTIHKGEQRGVVSAADPDGRSSEVRVLGQHSNGADTVEVIEVCDSATVKMSYRALAHLQATWKRGWALLRRAPAIQAGDARPCRVTVVVATRNRANALDRLLASIKQQTIDPRQLSVIVVNNGSTDSTQDVLRRHSGGLNLTVVTENVPGKSRALNRALEIAEGDLAVFTDDDVIPPPNWLVALQRASAKYLSASVFCGPVTPEFPAGTPDWLRSHTLGVLFFARFEPRLPEGPLPAGVFPPGANYAVRTAALGNLRFDLRLGPSQENGPLYDEDTEFLSRLQARTGRSVIVPEAQVIHHFEPSRVELRSLFEKSFYYGLTKGLTRRSPLLVPMWLMRLMQIAMRIEGLAFRDASEIERFDTGCLFNFYSGQLQGFQRRNSDHCVAILKRLLKNLDSPENRVLLSKPAMSCLDNVPGSAPASVA
jgi:glucosyl-dolichyl phosphate glucuronosyltransferase